MKLQPCRAVCDGEATDGMSSAYGEAVYISLAACQVSQFVY